MVPVLVVEMVVVVMVVVVVVEMVVVVMVVAVILPKLRDNFHRRGRVRPVNFSPASLVQRTYTTYDVPRTTYNIRCIVFDVQYTTYNVRLTMNDLQCTQYALVPIREYIVAVLYYIAY